MLTQLNPVLPLITPKGRGMAILVNDGSPELDLVWTVIDDLTGQIWCWSNREVRAEKNITWGRLQPERPDESKAGAR